MTRLAFAIALAFVGCGSLQVDPAKVVDAPDRAGEAIQMVADLYGMTSLPMVYWYGRQLDCLDGLGYHNQDGQCRSGEELGGVIAVALPPDTLISGTKDIFGCALLTHEMAHAASEQAGQDGCDNHDCRWFKGPCQAATAMLVEMGL